MNLHTGLSCEWREMELVGTTHVTVIVWHEVHKSMVME